MIFYLNISNPEVLKKISDLSRDNKHYKQFVLVIQAIKAGFANTTQFNYEGKCSYGDIYAIKVDEHRFYTIIFKNDGYKNFYICRYGKKQSQQNDRKLTTIIDSMSKIELQNFF